MDIQIFLCEDAATLLTTLGELGPAIEVVYRTPDDQPESGKVISYTRPATQSAQTLKSFTDKFVIVSRRN